MGDLQDSQHEMRTDTVMIVRDIMDNNPLIVSQTDSFERLLNILSHGVANRLACVVDEKGRLAGVLTSYDVLRVCLGRSGLWNLFSSECEDEGQAILRGLGRTAADLMTRSPYSVQEDASCLKALELIVSKRIGAVPVLNSEGFPIGEVSRSCLLHLFDAKRRELFMPSLESEIRQLRIKRSKELSAGNDQDCRPA